MTTFLTDNSVFTASIGVPEANDPLTAASVRGAFQGLLDRTAWLRSSASFISTRRDASGAELLRFKAAPPSLFGGWASTGINTGSLLIVSQGVGPVPPYVYPVVGNNSTGVRFSSLSRCAMAGCNDAVSLSSDHLRVSMWITPMTPCTGSQLLVEKRYRKDQTVPSSGSIFQPGVAWDMYMTQTDSGTPGFNSLQVRIRTGQSGTTSMIHQLVNYNLDDQSPGGIIPFQLNHVGFAYDGSFIRGYINGVNSTSNSCTGSIDYNTGSANTGPGPLAIGARVSTNDGQVQPFIGIIHELTVEAGPNLHNDQWWADTYLTGSRRYTYGA